MGRLVDQFCAACDESFYRSPSGQSLLAFILALIGGAPVVVDPQSRLSPYLATVAHIQIMLEKLVYGSKMSESSLVVGLIRAIEDVLEDCSNETLAPEDPEETPHWSQAAQRLIRYGLLVDVDGGLTVAGDNEVPALDQARQARADLEMWRELTALILEEQNLEQSIRQEVEDE